MCLQTLREFPEVIVFDNGSTDDTLATCARYPNVKVVTGEFLGFGRTKSHAVTLARGDWVLSVDADECLSDVLLDTLRKLPLDDAQIAYALNRHNMFMGKHIRYGGWGNNWLVRLFNRQQCQFDDSVVHEKVAVAADVEVRRLDGALWHHAVTDIDQFLTKISRYSELEVYRSRRTHSPLVTAVHAAWAFFRSYILQAGFVEGWRGLVIASSDGIGCFFKHMKRYVNNIVLVKERERPNDSIVHQSSRSHLT